MNIANPPRGPAIASDRELWTRAAAGDRAASWCNPWPGAEIEKVDVYDVGDSPRHSGPLADC